MVRIEISGDLVTFTVQAWQVPLALRRSVHVRLDQITGLSAPPRGQVLCPGLRLPGTHIPWLLTAGTYVGVGRREFWCVTRPATVLVVDLDGHASYTRMVLETADPQADMRRLGSAVASTPLASHPVSCSRRGASQLTLDRRSQEGI